MTRPVEHLLGGRYEVGELIGRGGMAEVHVGFDTRLGRPVAIKILRSDHVRDASFLSRFRREAHSVAGLNHPAIVAVYDSGEDHALESGGASIQVPYIVMEFVSGKTLRGLLNERGVLSPNEAARVMEAVLSALDYSHRMGIVHRDIKPANVMVTDDGGVKVMDFGIARAVADTAATMTQTSSVMGTAQYISPEQAEGHTVDSRSDLYSAGCLLFELLTGRTPFVGEPVSLTYQHVTKAAPRPSSLSGGVSEDYDAIVAHALTKNRELRYQDAESFRADLYAARLGLPISDAAQASLRHAAETALVTVGPPQQLAPTPVTPLYADPNTADYGTAYDEPARSRAGVVFLVLALIVSLGLLGFAGKTYLDSRPKQLAVPRVIGDQVDIAKARVKAAGFQVTTAYQPNRQVPKDEVFDQDPGALTLQTEGTLVTLTVSGGPAATRVPDLVGKTRAEAENLIGEAGLDVGSVDTIDSPDQAKDHVVSATPAPFTDVAEGDSISLKIASGKVSLVDLSNLTEDQARNVLAALKLPVVTETQESDQPEGTVIKQSPKAGKVNVGTTVTITLARPRTVTTTTTVTTTESSSSTTSNTSSNTSSTDTTSSSTSPPVSQSTPPPSGGPAFPPSRDVAHSPVRSGGDGPALPGAAALGLIVGLPFLLARRRRRH